MRTVGIALHLALASANGAAPDDGGREERAFVTRVGQPICADLTDLQNLLAAAVSGGEATRTAVGSCSVFQLNRKAVVLHAFRRGAIKVKVFVGRGSIAGYTTRVGVRSP